MTAARTAYDDPPEIDALVYDAESDRVSVFMARQAGKFLLRPQGGGIEWAADPHDVRAAGTLDVLTVRVREINRRGEEGRH